jgi:ABC-2 type transport system permease protein
MIALDTAPGTATVDAGPRTEKVALPRLTLIELRKLADTRSGLWLLIVIGLGSAATAAVLLAFAPDTDQTFATFFSFGLLPPGVLLPVLGILSMTSEWSQRTALTTFALVPRRGRVIVAKLAAGVLIALAATAATCAFAAGANLIARGLGGDASWHLGPAVIAQSALMEVLFVLMGLGFGALLLNSPLAIVLYFVIPTAWTFLGGMVKALHTAAAWLDLNETSTPLGEPGMTAGQWYRLGVSVAVWVVVPLLAGTVRMLRREVS